MIQKLLYLADWQIFLVISVIGVLVANGISFWLLRQKFKIFADLKIWQALILILLATSFVVGPVLLVWLFISISSYQNLENSTQAVFLQRAIETYTEFLNKLFEPLLSSWVIQNSFLMMPMFGLFLSVYFLPLLLIFATPVVLSFRNKSWAEKARLLGLTVVNGIVSTIALVSVLYILMVKIATPIVDACWQRTGGLGQFRAHLEDLCVNRLDTSECPKNEGAVMAFNPEGYARAQSCTNLSYRYHSEKGALWVVQDKFNSFTIYKMKQGKLEVLTRPYAETKQIEKEYE